MNKTILLLAALCSATVANAGFLRVNNVDASAPYQQINAAVADAAEGDTILVEGSTVDYEAATLDKRLVLIGPGYWLRENGIGTEATQTAIINGLTTKAAGSAIMGVYVVNTIQVEGERTVINRCYAQNGISISETANNCIIRQNFITGDVGSGYNHSGYHQITNNIFGSISCKGVNNCYIAYNTEYTWWGASFWNSANNKIEHNIFFGNMDDGDGNDYADNATVGELFKDITTDRDVQNTVLSDEAADKGAFAGDSPYVISGIPAGPMIEELVVPASVEEGSMMEVTIKLGTAK